MINIIDEFDRRAKEMLKGATTRGEPVYGIKPWYCSVRIIENGAKVAFIGANPGGGPQSEEDDKQRSILRLPYENKKYNAWLDDTHWENGGEQQQRAIEVFRIFFGPQRAERILRNAACFNVVPLRSKEVKDLSLETWKKGVSWCVDVLEHVSPKVIVCNGNGNRRSAWSVFRLDITELEERKIYNTFSLKRGRIACGKLAGALVIGLPHLSRMKSIRCLKNAAAGWEIC